MPGALHEPHWQSLKNLPLAVYGGSFDPPHQGHKALVEGLIALGYHVILVPTQNPIAKEAPGRAKAADRLAMCELEFGSLDALSLWDFELRSDKTTYAIDIYRELQNQLACVASKGEQLQKPSWVIGMDLLPTISRWKEAEELFSAVELLVVRRPHEPVLPLSESYRPYRLLDLPEVSGSSREIRGYYAERGELQSVKLRAVELRADAAHLDPAAHPDLSPAVATYVIEHELYSQYNKIEGSI